MESWDHQNFFHPLTHVAEFSRGNLAQSVIKTASGRHIIDHVGNQFFDAFAGLYSVNVGYERTEIAEALSKQAYELAFYHAKVYMARKFKSPCQIWC